ncbi:hypothetical protein HD553DRAFT_313082 [Filobasidium floriforme]|uniref:uncharacterized protein n=1 Tax=Filobasidium floriforme TaxID=5210 RepID=UPI001E8EDCB6|nr:uncharacterized protein HD553DRAFT_313082 [Filobasidium floriforme]KAH8083004.1 hypothetical protein HD553DRAFT_313082 [Filobasidium floriforme]
MSDSKQDNTFEPTHPFNLEDPKSWAEGVGALDWDKTHICFTKRSLLEFLKQNGVSVGVNYKELEKLPKYASFGEFSSKATETAVKDLVEAEVADPHSEDQPQQNTFRPSRKVREPPGGKSTINFAWGEHEEEDALSMAPPKLDGGKEEILKHTERDSFGFVVGK